MLLSWPETTVHIQSRDIPFYRYSEWFMAHVLCYTSLGRFEFIVATNVHSPIVDGRRLQVWVTMANWPNPTMARPSKPSTQHVIRIEYNTGIDQDTASGKYRRLDGGAVSGQQQMIEARIWTTTFFTLAILIIQLAGIGGAGQ